MKDKVKSVLNGVVNNTVENAGTVGVAAVVGSVVGIQWVPDVARFVLNLVGAG